MRRRVEAHRSALGALCLSLGLILTACGGAEEVVHASTDSCRVAQRPILLPAEAGESSGAAVSGIRPDLIWTHNDSGGEPALFGVNVLGQLVARVEVIGASNVDWEDLAAGPCPAGRCLYIADTGDNEGERSDLVIYRIPEPTPEAAQSERAEAFPIRYPDGYHDAEALFVLPPDRLYLVTKGGEGAIAVYRYPGELRAGVPVQLERVRELSRTPVPLADRVTAAAASPEGDRVALRTRTTLLLYDAAELVGSGSATPIQVDLTPLGEAQGEAVTFGPNGAIALTSEGVSAGSPGALGILWCP